MPPNLQILTIYFDQKGAGAAVNQFYDHFTLRKWKTLTGRPIRNWKALAADWIFEYLQEQKRLLRKMPFYDGH